MQLHIGNNVIYTINSVLPCQTKIGGRTKNQVTYLLTYLLNYLHTKEDGGNMHVSLRYVD